MDFSPDNLRRLRDGLQTTKEVLNSPVPGASIPIESLDELRALNKCVSSVQSRLDQLETDSRLESERQSKRFLASLIVQIAACIFAGSAAVIALLALLSS